MIFLNRSSIILAAFLLIYLVGTTAGAIENVGKDKSVNRGSPPSTRGSNDTSVIVDGDRDGEITVTPIGPDDTTNFLVECTACYISTSTHENMWIRIDLADNCFVTEINVFTGNVFVTMSRINILTKPETGNVNPVDKRSYWNSVYYEESRLSEWKVDIRPASYSLYVAVVRESSGGLTLSEVEVFGYAPADFKPKNLKLSQTSSDCVKLDWDKPYTDVEANYQYSCGTSSWKSSGSNTYGTVCGLTPAVGLQCSVRVDDVTQTKLYKKLRCPNLLVTQPANLTFSTGSKVQNGGRWRYQYSVSWKVPLTYTSCVHPSNPYRVEIDSTTESKIVNNYNKESYTVYGDSEDTITVEVQIRNKDEDLSSPATKSLTVPIGLPPQVAPRNFKLTAVSPYCVSLSYDPVLYPNGPESGIVYQYNCNSGSWKNIPSNKQVCEFTPNTLVNCEIRARSESNFNGNKDSETATHSETTCNNPFQSSSLQFNSPTMVTSSGRKRWKYTLTWQISSTYNCKGSSYRYKLNIDGKTTLSNSTSTSRTIYRDGNVDVSAEVWLIQRNGDLSESVRKSIVTKQGLPPQVAPRNFKLTTVSPYCVSLSYDPVLYPNGPESGLVYQYNCNAGGWKNIPSDNQVCGFTPNTLVNCKIRARRESNSNNIRNSEVAAGSATTPCPAVPDKLQQLSIGEPSQETHSNRKRWKYTITWQEPETYGCIHPTNPYQLQVDSNSVIQNYKETSYTLYRDGGVSLTIKVWLRNKHGVLSEVVTKTITTSTVNLPPQVAPRNFKLTAVSPYCVSLSYDPVEFPNGPESGLVYQYNCNSGGWKNIPSNKQVCGFTPNTLVNCEIRATRGNNANNNQNSEVATDSVTTPCPAVPDKPHQLSIGEPSQVTHTSRKRWKYTITWQEPETYGCIHPSNPYQLQVDSNSVIKNYKQTSHTLYRDGGVSLTIKVWLRNKHGVLSEVVTKTITTSTINLPPQVAPRSFNLTAASPYCVSLSYDPVEYPNGPESGLVYQVKCNSQTWMKVPDNKELCGYEPYELVTCDIRARRESNSQGNRDSEISTDSVTTDCAASILPTNIFEYLIQSRYTPSGSDRRKIRVQYNLPVEDITINCEYVKLREFKLNSSTEYLDHNSYINNLLPYKNYTIQVKITNNKDLSTEDMLVIETWELEPYDSPVILRNESYNESCIFIQWRSPSQPNGVINRYQHRYYNISGKSAPSWMNYTDVQTENSYLACGYRAGDLVTYEIRAGTEVGYGPEATGDVRVTCGYPAVPEYSTVSSNYTQKERERIRLNITWEESYPACASISHYDLTIKLNEQQIFYKRYSVEEIRGKVLEDLDPYTNYTIILIAVNNALNKSSAEPRYITTPVLAPYDGPSLSIDFDTSCAHLTIQDPTQPNGIITEYQYTCYYANTEEGNYQSILATDKQPVSLCEFRSAEKVKCSAKAINSAGESPVTSQTGYTKIAVTQNDKAELKKTKNVGKSFAIRVNQVTLDNKKPNSYLFVVQKEASTSKRKKRSSVQLPPECDLDPDCYITAEIDSSLVDSDGYDFRVGDGKTYQDYYNAPLEPNQDYKIYQAVTVQMQDGAILVAYFEDPIIVILNPACDQNCTIAVSVTNSIVVLTVVVVGIIFIMQKRQGKRKESRDSDHQLDEISSPPIPERSSSKPTIAERIRRSLQRNDVYEQFELTSLSIGNLEDYVKQKQHIKDQYKAFNSIPKPVMSAALLAENKGKCRYKGLYPADETRVVLQRESSTESDFINASHIDGFSQEARRMFIAAQGPMKATVDDFWLMIWQQRPKAVVMVTNVIEDRKQKCEQYWPDDTSTELRYGDITVSMVSAEEWAEYVVRVLNIEKNGEKRRVRQYHYTAWPDHGVPDSMSPFISFYKKIKTETYRIDGALLVHCSAGVGRTGTFIAMSNLLEQAEMQQQVDFFESVKKMRANRPSMVQTVEQYVFLHCVVNEFLATAKYPCAPSDIRTKLANHGEANNTYSNMATAEIDEEFFRIGRYVSDHGLDVDEGRKPENSNKNRSMTVLPPSAPPATDKKEKSLRPVISSGNGYINAVMVNAYRKKNQFIATQLPLVNTMTDFWQMIEEYRVSVIVQLDPCKANELFYPPTTDEMPLTFGDFVIVRLTTESTEKLTSIALRVTKSQSSRNIYVLQKTNWSREDETSNAETLSFLEILEKHQQKTGNHNICVTSLDGGAKCGMFICSHNAIEKMKAEQEADLYSTVLMARLRRPQFLTTLESYVGLYDLLREFGENFSDYENFK